MPQRWGLYHITPSLGQWHAMGRSRQAISTFNPKSNLFGGHIDLRLRMLTNVMLLMPR